MSINVEVVKGSKLDLAIEVEHKVFTQQGYPYNYTIYNQQSEVIAAFDGEVCVGALRLISQSPILPPVLKDCTVWNLSEWTSLGVCFEELGTVAVLPEYEHSGIALSMYFTATASALARGVSHWGIIVEPEVVEFMNSALSFVFEPIGELGYKGWDCAPFAMGIKDAITNIYKNNPSLHKQVMSFIPEHLHYP